MMNKTFWIIFVVLAVILAGIFFGSKSFFPGGTTLVSTTTDVYVTSTTTLVVTNNLKTYTDATSSATFMYEDPLRLAYIRPFEWPPHIAVMNKSLSCASKERKTIGGQLYCVTSVSDGAAGSTYITYTYSTEMSGKTVSITFTLQEVQCLNYDDPKQTECLSERTQFNPDTLASDIMKTVVLKSA